MTFADDDMLHSVTAYENWRAYDSKHTPRSLAAADDNCGLLQGLCDTERYHLFDILTEIKKKAVKTRWALGTQYLGQDPFCQTKLEELRFLCKSTTTAVFEGESSSVQWTRTTW